jgi:hypothetical protein
MTRTETTFTFRADRTATERGGHGMAIQLPGMYSTPQVFWSDRSNSYVCDGAKIYSINGIGEIRWTVEEWNRDAESNAARAYFFTITTAFTYDSTEAGR